VRAICQEAERIQSTIGGEEERKALKWEQLKTEIEDGPTRGAISDEAMNVWMTGYQKGRETKDQEKRESASQCLESGFTAE
jgi:hypothetical protein